MALKSYCIFQISVFLFSLLQDMTNENSKFEKQQKTLTGKLEKPRNTDYWKLEDFEEIQLHSDC